MKQWGRWRGNTDSSGMESGLATCSLPLQLKFSLISTTIYFTSLYFSPFLSLPLYFSPLYHPPPPQLLFFLFFPSHPVHRERCFGSHVTFCPDTIAGVCHWPMFLWKSVGFPGDREWRHHFTFLCSCLPPPLPSALLWAGLSLSLPQAVVDQVAHEHDTHRQWRWLCSSSSSPSSPFSSGSRQSQRPLGCRRWVKQMALFVEI